MPNPLRNPDVRYCPICKADLSPEASRGGKRPAHDSCTYRCTNAKCNRLFEINDHTQ